MSTRLEQFISAENLSQSQFADTIGVARASVSHILSGRNKPGFDFIESMARHFPALNLDWLITGKGKMYKNESAPRDERPDDLFASSSYYEDSAQSAVETPLTAASGKAEIPDEKPAVDIKPASEGASISLQCSSRVSKIIIFYEDNTFQELK